jgi:hypothetical protein
MKAANSQVDDAGPQARAVVCGYGDAALSDVGEARLT